MKYRFTLNLVFFIVFSLFSYQKTFSQCFQIESILVDACDTGTDEGLNEMVRFKVGAAAINTSSLSVNWPSNSWTGLIQNATTISKVATLNAQINSVGGCGQLIEPLGGLLPENAKVILVTSYNFNVALNYFGAINENIYIIFQNNPANTTGHFANYNVLTGSRTLVISFTGCSDTVSYERSLLVNTNGFYGGNAALNDGATVNFTSSGTPTYINNGCVAPVEVFTVNAGSSPINTCAGSTISLLGNALGQQSVAWSAPSGSFTSAATLATNYTLSPSASGSILLTLSATNTCSITKTSTITVNVTSGTTPTFTAVAPICSGGSLSALPTTSNNSITGTWSPSLDNTATKIYTFTPTVGQCATTATLTITLNPLITPTFTTVSPICSGGILLALPTTSNNSITGAWSPALDNTATKIYTFTPTVGQCATTANLTITVNPLITPTFTAVSPICSGGSLSALPTTSNNSITGAWSPALDNTATKIYTFTPTVGQCATTATLTITVNPLITPTFTAVPSICSGGSLSALPTISNNSIAGTWSPALDNTATKTYTFTPTVGQCATTATLTITVNPLITPTFTAVSPICSGGSLSALPTTSNNSIAGTWSPALDNTATKTYTFTPTVGQCATTTTLSVTVKSGIDFEITGNCVNGSYIIESKPLSNSYNSTTATYQWKDNLGNNIGSNEAALNVSSLLASTSVVEAFPLTYTLTITSSDGCTNTKNSIVYGAFCAIPKGISPDGDSKNDEFDLTGLGVEELHIFNRYGTEVYSFSNYTKEWHGQSNGGDELPDGTYFYSIHKVDGTSATGWVYINRKQ